MQIALNEFKAKISEYLKDIKEPIFITKHGKVVAKVLPSSNEEVWEDVQERMKGSVTEYNDPENPVGEEDWTLLP